MIQQLPLVILLWLIKEQVLQLQFIQQKMDLLEMLILIEAQEEQIKSVALNVIQTREQSMMLGTSLGAVNQASEMYFHYTSDAEL